MDDGAPSRSRLKRPLHDSGEDDDGGSNKAPAQKRVRFPKGKKVKPGDEGRRSVFPEEEGPGVSVNPKIVATERANRRSLMTTEMFHDDVSGGSNNISAAEVPYEDDENFEDDGIQIEPFNLDKEREEGYFDASGNFVEYVRENEIRDAWLDNIDFAPQFASARSLVKSSPDENQELSSQDIGILKRRIADLLEPEETVLQALRRLKGSTGNRKEKMSAETKHLFDELTEAAMTLMENGEYNVYHEKKEVFQREAEGYERLARARDGGSGDVSHDEKPESSSIFSGLADADLPSASQGLSAGPSNQYASAANASDRGGEEFDMFGEGDEGEGEAANSSKVNGVVSPENGALSQPSTSPATANAETAQLQNDYIYDENSGYYYSSSLGHFYDPSTGLYCSASSGQWYSYNEETGSYEEVPAAPVSES
ncbi:hypothetical protein MLD38_023213 [Melastoma candidum]|uniref:Uncharacterized protein n=1 Tax=Melastoma candidum TaxID=119954 RepID=A0ACB9QMZ9_9MYRT|nr:hypothetical protein MLD38_023213 [Melastoma candidum]